MPEKKLRNPIPAGPRPITNVMVTKGGKPEVHQVAGERPMKECDHKCVHCGAPLREA